MATGDLYQVKDHQQFGSMEILNVYHYRHVDGVGDWSDMAGAWSFYVLPKVIDIQHNAVTHTSVEVINLDDPGDYGIDPHLPPVAGTSTNGQSMPAFVAFEFRLNRTTRAVRHGHKRICGVPENANNAGDLEAVFLTVIGAYATILGQTIEAGGSANLYQPRIVRPAGLYKAGQLPRSDYAISSAEFVRISTQNTRK